MLVLPVAIKPWKHLATPEACHHHATQALKADVVFGDFAYFCHIGISEVLKVPRVSLSNVPVPDPVHTSWDRSTGRRMNIPNLLAYTPQVFYTMTVTEA